MARGAMDSLLGNLRRRPLGRDRVPGLRASVEVTVTEGGIPHLVARDEDDLFLAQGYVTARDRLWQLDFLRRAAEGRLAEILGERPVAWRHLTVFLQGRTTVDVDALLRCFGLREAAEASLAAATPFARRCLERYAEGVNAFLATGRRPFECRLLRYRPGPWRPVDSLVVARAIAFELCLSWRLLLGLEGLRGAVPDPERFAALLPMPAPGERPPLPEAARLAALAAAEASALGVGGPHAGSNAWAVAGTRSASGAPLLAADPHLALGIPGPFHLVHLTGGRFDVAGAALPGLPGIAMGHNERVAWGFTLLYAHDADLFAERIEGDEAVGPAGREPVERLRQEIAVRGRAAPAVRELRRTRHGPVLTDVVDPLHRGGTPLALRWTGSEPSGEVDAALGLCLARNGDDVRAALRTHGAPAIVLVWADRDGGIGLQAAGRIPVRAGGDLLPVRDGASGAEEWTGWVPFEALPSLVDPEDGLVAAANQRPPGPPGGPYLSSFFEPPYRHRRIRRLLVRRRLHDRESFAAIQRDQHSAWAARLVDELLAPLASAGSGTSLSPRAKDALARVLAWDRVASADSDGAAVFHLFYDALVGEILAPLERDLVHGLLEVVNTSVLPLEELLVSGGTPWLPAADRDRTVARALEKAAATLVRRLGPDPARWRWGRLHRLRLRHRLDQARPLRPLLSPGPFETGGDGTTVNNGTYVHAAPADHLIGAAYRQVFDLADWDLGLVITHAGQSGDPFSRGYRDHLPRWRRGVHLPLPFTPAAVARAALRRERLRPG